MIGYDPSYLNETETLLEEFHKIQKYLFENPIYKIYQANVDYVTGVNEYYITDVTTRSGDVLGVGDVVLFRNVYYGVITEINEDTQMFTIAEGISFRGARGLQGEVGATGATGATGKEGLEYLGAVIQFEYDGDEFDEPLTFNNSDFNRTPSINDGFLFMYHLNESDLSYIVNGRVTAVGTDTCKVTISPQARQEVTGPVGPAGPTGPVGEMGLSIYLYDGEITSTTTTATTAQVEVPTGRTLQVFDILFSTYETTFGAMAEVTEIHDTGLRIDYIGQVASAGGGGVSDVQVNGVSVVANGVANIPYASDAQAGIVSTGEQQFKGEKGFINGIRLYYAGNQLNYMIANMATASQLKFTNNGASVEGFRFYNGSGSTTDAYFGIGVSRKAQTELIVNTGTKDFRYYFLDDHRTGTYKAQTLLSASETWSTGTSGTAKLPSAGLYEIKFTLYNHVHTFTLNWDGTSVTYGPMFIVDAEQGGVLAPFVDATGIIEVYELESGPASANVSYRKIGIA